MYLLLFVTFVLSMVCVNVVVFNVVYLWFGVYVFVCNVFVLNGFVMCAYEISCLQLCSCVVWRICLCL